MSCQKCFKNRPIVNKRHGLCTECNQKRMYGDGFKPKVYHLKPISIKETINKKAKHEAYAIVAGLIKDKCCKGCGVTSTLTHSHLIPISKRKDLENNPLNITYHCLINHCHSKWESNNIKQMSTLLDFEENMERVKQLDIRHYNVLMYKLENNV